MLNRLTTVEIIRQNRGPASSLRLQVAAMTCDECGAIPWDELQVKSHYFTSTLEWQRLVSFKILRLYFIPYLGSLLCFSVILTFYSLLFYSKNIHI